MINTDAIEESKALDAVLDNAIPMIICWNADPTELNRYKFNSFKGPRRRF